MAQQTSAHNQHLTLADIARQTNYSISTVSKVLNDQSDISPEAKERVNAVLTASGYRRKSRQHRHQEFIDIVFSSFSNLWAFEVVKGALNTASQHDIRITITESGDRNHPAENWASDLVRRHPLGAVLVFSHLSTREREELDKNDIFYSIFDPSGEPEPQDFSVRADNWNGGMLAARHLADLGHQRIAMITGPEVMLSARARTEGFIAALADRNISFNPALKREGDFTMVSGLREGLELLNFPAQERPTAIFAGNDLQAMGVYEAARQTGLRIPQDLSVVGFDDLQTSSFMNPPLTTISQPLQQMAGIATQMVINRANHEHSDMHVVLPTSLIERESTARPQN